MTQVRRVVTGHTEDGVSVVADDGTPGFVAEMGEGEPVTTVVWATEAVPSVPSSGDPTTALGYETIFPAPGETRLLMVRHPPGAGTRVGAAAPEDTGVEMDATGMHASDSVDYIVMVSGTMVVELDDGVEVELHAGDVLVQNGTRHGWRNRTDEDAVVAVVLIGATRTT